MLWVSDAKTHVFMRQGLYRREASARNVIYLDATTRSSSFEAAAAALP